MSLLVATASLAMAGLDPAKAINQYMHEVWRTENGLPHNTVTVVSQTRDGYLWIGSEEGLARFDGVKFTTFDTGNTPALKSNVILSLLEDRQGTLWVGTNGGLTRLRSTQDRAYTTQDGLAGDVVTSLCEDRKGNLWIGTDGGGLSRLSGGTFQNYGTHQGLAAPTVFAIAEDRVGDVWFGTQAGLSRWSNGTLNTLKELHNRDIRALLPDAAGALWIGTNGGGLFRMEQGSVATYTTRNGLRSNNVRALLKDSEGTLWVAALGGGLNRYRNGKFESGDNETLPAADVWWLFEDREGSMWMGTIGKGLHRLREATVTMLAGQQGLSSDAILGVFEDREGALWFGAKGTGLNRWKDGKVTSYTARQGLSDPLVFSMVEDSKGDLWVGTRNGLNQLHQGKITVYTTHNGLPSNTVPVSLLDHQGRLWFGTRNGLCRWDNGRCVTYTTAQGLSSNFVISLRETRDGSLWVGTAGGGVNRFQNGQFTVYGPKQGLSSGVVFDIYEDSDGALWLGTSAGGLNRWKNGRWTAIGIKEGLLDSTVFRILEDGQNRFWLSSNKGISRVDRKALNDLADGRIRSVHAELYSQADGMKSQECNGGFQPAGWKARDGKLYFPTMQGAVLIDPSRLETSSLTPPVVLEQVILNGRSVDFSQGIDVPPGVGNLEFHYTALSFIAPKRVSFKYQLAGFDPTWVEAGTRREAYYTNIPPGKYRFRVIAANEEGLWNTAGASTAFTLRPHFYNTTFFYALCVLLIVSAAVSLHRLRIRQFNAREKELSARVQEHTHELREQIVARDRAHEELRDAQQRLIDLSRQAGMAEIATSVLHNVGNVLNSVNVAANIVAGKVRDSQAEKLPALVQLLQQHADHIEEFLRCDPKGQRVLPYMVKLSAYLQQERQTLLKELKLLTDHVDHIKEIVATQQSYATRSGMIEEVSVADLVEDAFRIIQPGLDRHSIVLEKDFDELPLVMTDKHKILQILINLLRNAKEAIKSGPNAERTIRVHIRRHGPDLIRLGVQDSGIGLSRENLTRIFAHGFTTKADGHGFGLHSGALAAQQMGGALWAESEGVGQGATFILEFPLVAETATHKAAA